MDVKVLFSQDPAFVLGRAGVFLSSQPVSHNLVLSILHARVAQGDPGRYWMAIQRDESVGVVAQSPLTFPATLTPMKPPVAMAMADAMVEAGVPLPGINGDAATTATFAGQWSERSKSAATPFQGNLSAVSDAPHGKGAGEPRKFAGRVRYSGLKGAARGEAIMPIQSCWG